MKTGLEARPSEPARKSRRRYDGSVFGHHARDIELLDALSAEDYYAALIRQWKNQHETDEGRQIALMIAKRRLEEAFTKLY